MAGLFDDLIPASGNGAPSAAPPSGNEARVPVTAYKPGAFDDLIPAAPEEQPTTVTGTLDAFGRGVAKGAGFGWADEAGAAARYLGGKVFPWQPEVTYDEALREVRGEDKAVADANPTADVAGQVTGVVGSAAAIAARARGDGYRHGYRQRPEGWPARWRGLSIAPLPSRPAGARHG